MISLANKDVNGIELKEFNAVEAVAFLKKLNYEIEDVNQIVNIKLYDIHGKSTIENYRTLITEDEKFFYWDSKRFTRNNLGDVVFWVNRTERKVLYTVIDSKEVHPTFKEGKNIISEFGHTVYANAQSIDDFELFYRFKIIEIASIPDDWNYSNLVPFNGQTMAIILFEPKIKETDKLKKIEKIEDLMTLFNENTEVNDLLNKSISLLTGESKQPTKSEKVFKTEIMNNFLIDFSQFETSNSKFKAELASQGGYITFSNSAKGKNKKHFTLSLSSFLICLNDIKLNLSSFRGHETYIEREWRDLGSLYYTDPAANAQCTVQTKPMFATLSKIIMWANSPLFDSDDPEKSINLESNSLNQAIEKLSNLIQYYTPGNSKDIIIEKDHEIFVEEKYIGRFTYKVLSFLWDIDELNNIDKYFKRKSDSPFTSIKTDDIRLSYIFKSSSEIIEKEGLAYNDGKPRFFADAIFNKKNEYYYLSTEWTHGKGSRLDLDDFKKLIEIHYPEYSIYEKNGINIFSTKIISTPTIPQINFNYNSFQKNCIDSGLKYTENLISRYVSSLVTKPFVLLSGLSGSGKTKLAQSFSQWICENESQYCIVPVGADWTNREPLLGYVNALDNDEYILPENGALKLLIAANLEVNKNKPYFLILDEMNLSHVERYFADFLSVMESKDEFKLHSDRIETKSGVPSHLNWPKNLYVVGTVNIDETTYMFSPKVLDRANVIEFRVDTEEIKDFLKSPNEINFEKLDKLGVSMGNDFVEITNNKVFKKPNSKELNLTLVHFFNELKKVGAEFGYRTGMEIHRLFNQLEVVNKKLSDNDKIDIVIMQKLLPKLHGSRRKLCPILEILSTLCVEEKIDVKKEFLNNKEELIFKGNANVIYPLSLEKITRMYKGAIDNGFASYAEA